eukprot:412595_1
MAVSKDQVDISTNPISPPPLNDDTIAQQIICQNVNESKEISSKHTEESDENRNSNNCGDIEEIDHDEYNIPLNANQLICHQCNHANNRHFMITQNSYRCCNCNVELEINTNIINNNESTKDDSRKTQTNMNTKNDETMPKVLQEQDIINDEQKKDNNRNTQINMNTEHDETIAKTIQAQNTMNNDLLTQNDSNFQNFPTVSQLMLPIDTVSTLLPIDDEKTTNNKQNTINNDLITQNDSNFQQFFTETPKQITNNRNSAVSQLILPIDTASISTSLLMDNEKPTKNKQVDLIVFKDDIDINKCDKNNNKNPIEAC